jgi:hypothetical protein
VPVSWRECSVKSFSDPNGTNRKPRDGGMCTILKRRGADRLSRSKNQSAWKLRNAKTHPN